MITNFSTIASTPNHSWLTQLKLQLKAMGKAAINFLIAAPHCEPIVTELEGTDGFTYWEIHDPITETTFYFMNEGEALEWLDSRH